MEKMKIKLFTIPNILTLANLLCGALAVVEIVARQNFELAIWLVLAAAAFDFLDGFSARLLGQYSSIGVELDSLADMVSFGLAPSLALFYLYGGSQMAFVDGELAQYLQYITLIFLLFAALRLAKFNVDPTQHEEFSGLPTPAAALFVLSLGYLNDAHLLELSGEMIALTSVVLALLMVGSMPMLALKFKGFSLGDNLLRYLFVLISAIVAIFLGFAAVPFIFLFYLFISLVLLVVRFRA